MLRECGKISPANLVILEVSASALLGRGFIFRPGWILSQTRSVLRTAGCLLSWSFFSLPTQNSIFALGSPWIKRFIWRRYNQQRSVLFMANPIETYYLCYPHVLLYKCSFSYKLNIARIAKTRECLYIFSENVYPTDWAILYWGHYNVVIELKINTLRYLHLRYLRVSICVRKT